MQKEQNKSIDWQIFHAVNLLKQGKIVSFPTETVYGLAADANNPEAIKKVFATKGRPFSHPLIVHISKDTEINLWAQDIPPEAKKLAKHFWPGPLTLVLSKQNKISPLITAGQTSIALRVPQHPLTLEILRQFGSGLVGPSANTFGRISPTTAQHVTEDLKNKVDYVLDGGSCKLGIESTIVSFINKTPVILRKGTISPEQISQVLGYQINFLNNNNCSQPKTSGNLASHYAPKKKLFLVAEKNIFSTINKFFQKNKIPSVLSFHPRPSHSQISKKISKWLTVSDNPNDYAKYLYANLRDLDKSECQYIIIESPPQHAAWAAILDRLQRASYTKEESKSYEQ